MIEVRLTTDHDDYWELKYMLDDAKEKAANKQFDELTEEQQALLAYTEPTLQTTIYWGKKFFRQQCLSKRLLQQTFVCCFRHPPTSCNQTYSVFIGRQLKK
jgi:hypothetical protein